MYSYACSEYAHDNDVYEEFTWSLYLEENFGILMMDSPNCEEMHV